MDGISFKCGPRAKFRNQEFWAEGGMICIEDQNDGDFKVLTRAEAAARAIALNDELKHIQYPSERDELMRCVVALCEAVKEGKRQGDPSDPEVRKDRIKSSRKVSLIKTLEAIPPSPPPSILTSEFSGLRNPTLVSAHSDRFSRLRI